MNSGVKKYAPIICAICGEAFVPKSGNTKYCDKCRLGVDKERWREYREYREIRNAKDRARRRRRKQLPTKELSWSDVVRICEENNLSYGKAKARGLI